MDGADRRPDRSTTMVLGSLVMAGVLAGAGGCTTPRPGAGGGSQPAIAEAPKLDLDATQADDPGDSELARRTAAQLQRDAEAFLAMQDDADGAPRWGGVAADPVPVPQGSTPTTTVIWDEPSRRADAASEQPASDADADEDDRPAASGAAEPSPGPDETATASADSSASVALAMDHPEVREMLVDLSRALYRESTYSDMPVRELFVIAATTMVSPDRALPSDALRGLTDREKELLLAFQQFFIDLGRELDGSREADAVITESLETLRQAISREPVLTIPTAALCTAVRGFGDFDRFDGYSFLAGRGQQAVVYVEVADFTSEINDDGRHVTKISQQLTIYSNRDGIPVWREDWQTAVDRSARKRTDFFIVQLITFPDALGVGRYNLKVRLRDETSGAEAETTIPFEMVADERLASPAK